MRSLLTVVREILNGAEKIPELPEDGLIATNGEGRPISVMMDGATFKKLARLQTLIRHEQKKAEMPDMDVVRQTAEGLGKTVSDILASSLGVQEDATSDIMMLERLMVAIVRDACPQESERMGVRYLADISYKVHAIEAPTRRFLD
jgi:hypothetical protein